MKKSQKSCCLCLFSTFLNPIMRTYAACVSRLFLSKSVCGQPHVGSNPTRCATSPRTSYRSRRLFYKSHLSLILSRLLSKSNPLALGFNLVLGAVLWAGASFSAAEHTSEQALYRLLRLFCKSQSALMPLLLLSKSNPLRWASIWFWVQTWKLRHLYCCDVP